MKKLFLVLLLATTLTLGGCAIGKMVDWYPVDLIIYVQDSEGSDLLNPHNKDFIATKVEAEWLGKTYTYNHQVDATKAYMPNFYGLELRVDDRGKYRLCFGELGGDSERDDDLTLRWSDGTTDVIHYKNIVYELFIEAMRTYKLNGEKCNNPIVIIK